VRHRSIDHRDRDRPVEPAYTLGSRLDEHLLDHVFGRLEIAEEPYRGRDEPGPFGAKGLGENLRRA
jgi:hypothetical protein